MLVGLSFVKVVKPMIYNILAGGPSAYLPDLLSYTCENSCWIGVDRGVFTLLSKGIKPAYAFGDFDSLSEKELAIVESEITNIHQYRPEKDETDLELALNWAIAQKPLEVRIFGATGGRLDHFLANVQLLAKFITPPNLADMFIIDHKNIITLRKPGTYNLPKLDTKKYISFLPFTTTVDNLTLIGFKYSLVNRNILAGSTLCISNELISNYGTYSFSNGILIVIRSQD
jgi:thiamine pyrophosphokinase